MLHLRKFMSIGKSIHISLSTSLKPRSSSTLSSFKISCKSWRCLSSTASSVPDKGQSPDDELIYVGVLAKQIRAIKVLSLTTSILGVGIQPFVYVTITSSPDGNSVMPLFGLIGTFAVVTPLLLHWVMKNYIINVHYQPSTDSYIATFYTLFCRKLKVHFTPEDVTVPTVLGMFANCAIHGKVGYMDPKNFSDQYHYKRIMGYDKPMEWFLDATKKTSD